ncbi:GIY-YIG nuclease family protein [Prochlorococcus marinus]|uniref:GIY-YIG nuclease family protein n=1 Tax=Prochlorococcus marinus TaxID=1219 RepID=UPI0022B340F2|nr:GIY-YIG nuclease family protein [Prochlorococcus marinus]
MSGWLYLIRNRDLYKIGITKKFESRMRQLKPDNIVAKFYTSDFLKLEKELHNRYKKFRIPQTEYFRLEQHHLKEIKQRIYQLDHTMIIILGIIFKSLLIINLLFFILLFVFSLNINDINIVFLKSIVWMEKISFGYSFISLFFHSGKYLSFLSELKYRFLKLIIFIVYALIFRIASIFFQ